MSEPSTQPTLLERLRQSQDQESWSKFVDVYSPLLLVWVRRLGVPDPDRADVLQEVFRVLLRELPRFQYDPNRKFRGYLYSITRSRVNDYFRQRAPVGSPINPDVPGPSVGIDDWVDADHNAYLVLRAFRLVATDFDATTAEAFRRTVFHGEPPAQVAVAVGISVPAVYQIRSRVLRRLREEFAGLLE